MITSLVAWLLTYLIHSSLWIGGAALLAACGVPRAAAVRAALWRLALVGGLATSLWASLGVGPHYGWRWQLPGQFETAAIDPTRLEAAAHAAPATPASARPSAVAADGQSLELAAGAASGGDQAWRPGFGWIVGLWLAGSAVLLVRMIGAWRRLQQRCRQSRISSGRWWPETVQRLAGRMGLRRPVEVLISPADFGPACTGLLRGRLFVPESLAECLDEAELEALAAHELAHLTRRDPAWSIVAQAVSGIAFFQPLNRYAQRQMQLEAEYAADELAATALAGGQSLAECLLQFRAWAATVPWAPRSAALGAVGMATFRSTLGRRVERLMALDAAAPTATSPRRRWAGVLAAAAGLLLLPGLAPRAVGVAPASSFVPGSAPSEQETSMPRPVLLSTMAAALLLAPDAAVPAAEETKPAAASVDKLPEKLHGFLGRVRGTLVDKDPEKGTVVLKITEVQRVWKGSKAADPEAAVGKTLVIGGVFGKFLDTLIVLDRGESIDIGARHIEGEQLAFPGELLKKSDPNETFDKPAPKPATPAQAEGTDAPQAAGPIPQGLAGFRGMMRGRVVSKDPEKGKVVIAVDAIVRTWPKNRAKNPQEAVGKELPVEGIFGKFLDVLITVDKGDRVEIEAFHNSGAAVLTFPGEWLKKVD